MEWDRKNPIEELCMEFAVKIVELSRHVAKTKHEFKMTDQVQRAGTAVGALYGEAQYSESDADYVHKVKIALKECHETKYWLELLFKTNHISESECEELYLLVGRIQKALIGCVKTAKEKMSR